MKYQFLTFLCITSTLAFSQQLELHYDPRHSLDPKRNTKNFTTLYFEYFKSIDSGNSFVRPGSFLLKIQSDLSGEKSNIGKFYMQVSQTFRFWRPNIYIHLQYSGGLGVTEPRQYSYYITNAFSLGVAHPFRRGNNAFFNAYISYKYGAFKKPSHDIILAFFWLKFFSNFKNNFSGNVVSWTDNKNHGDTLTMDLKGKRFSILGDPQLWFTLKKGFSVGTKINLYYHVLTSEDIFQAYPTLGVRYKF